MHIVEICECSVYLSSYIADWGSAVVLVRSALLAKIKLSRYLFKCQYFMLSGLKAIPIFWLKEYCFLRCKVAHDSFLHLNFGEPILILFFSWCYKDGVCYCILRQATTILSALRAFRLFFFCFKEFISSKEWKRMHGAKVKERFALSHHGNSRALNFQF